MKKFPMKSGYLKSLLIFSLFFAHLTLFAQTNQFATSYYPGNYSQQPIVTFKEGFLNKRTFFLDGKVTTPKDIEALLRSIQNEDFDIRSLHNKKAWGTAVRFTGIGISLGSIAYLFTNDISSSNFRPWFWITLGGAIMQATGNALVEDSQKRIAVAIDDFNAYHYSGGSSKFLRLDVRNRFFGPQIDIYEGTMLLQKDQVFSLLNPNEIAFDGYKLIQKRQQVSRVTHIANSALGIGIMFLSVGFQRQSSAQNELLIPLMITGTGLSIFSSNYDRKTRNLAREVLYRYNYD